MAYIVGKDAEVQAKNTKMALFLWRFASFGGEMPIIAPYRLIFEGFRCYFLQILGRGGAKFEHKTSRKMARSVSGLDGRDAETGAGTPDAMLFRIGFSPNPLCKRAL